MGFEVNYTWSYSSISLFMQCPRKYHRLRVVKDIVEPVQEHLLYGSAVHKAAEEYVRDDTPIPEKYGFIQEYLYPLKALPGDKLCEYEMGVRADLTPCGFMDKDVWCRGIADLLIINDDNLTARVIDYKTGNNKYPDREQLKLMALMVFAHFPHIRRVEGALLFVVKDDIAKASFMVGEAEEYWWDYRERVARIEQAHETGVWNPKPTPLCGWCPCTDCEYNKKRN